MNAHKVGIQKQMKALSMSAVLLASPVLSSQALAQSAEPKSLLLQGVAQASSPLKNALIRVYDRSGNLLAEKSNATNKDGFFEISLQKVPRTTLIVEASGGLKGEENFDGTLYGNILPGSQQNFVHLNAATTLSSLLQELHPSVSATQADSQVRKFLNISQLLDLGFSIENPYLTTFSAKELEKAAQAHGGYNNYIQALAAEMAGSPSAVHAFPVPQGQGQLQGGPGTWLAEKLLAGIAGKIGADIFSGFMAGIGFPDKDTQILNLLNQVMARLDAIQNSLKEIELKIGEAEYNMRTSALWKSYNQYTLIVNQMKQTDLIAKANLDAQGKPKSVAVQQQVIAAGKAYVEQIKALRMTFVSDVNAEFVTEGTITALPQVFAQNQYLKNQIINKDYFKTLNDHLEKYLSLQAVVTTLYSDALKLENQVMADAAINTAIDFMKAEKVVYPAAPFFSSKYVEPTIKGKMFFDKEANLIWDTTIMHFDGCKTMHNFQRSATEFTVAGYDQIVGMLNRTGNAGKKMSDAMINIGYTKQLAEGTKMIVIGCQEGRRVKEKSINWFGNDQRGPWDQYFDSLDQFRGVANGKGQGAGFNTMSVAPLK